eukprot:14200820-Ditylum_brightwellii.AAC.1
MYEQQKPSITNPLAQFDCLPCNKGIEEEEVEWHINNAWWDLTKVELSGGDISEKLLLDEKKDTIK